MTLKIEGVWCKTKTEFDKLARSQYCDLAISYSDIHARLIKSDPYGQEPSDTIITLYIMRMITKVIIERQTQESTNILYMFKNLDQETICNLQKFIRSITEDFVEFNLTVINQSEYPKRGVLSKFHNVKFVEND